MNIFEAEKYRDWSNKEESATIAHGGYLGDLRSTHLKERDHQMGRVHWMREIFQLIQKEKITGDILEFGSWRGQSLVYMAHLRNKFLSPQTKISGIDSFEGLPLSEDGWTKGGFSDTSIDYVKRSLQQKKEFCGDLSNICLVKSLFSDKAAIDYIENMDEASFIYYDADIKTSTLKALSLTKKFFDNQKKIFIGFDDWGCQNYTLCAAFGKMFHHMNYLTFRIIGSTNYTIFFEVNNLKNQ